ncbi:hypothetical protein PFICI_00292 [Pestalotiopsis fici W106-1]|uniref:Uncharacterized protein n=1 Tax=Pestalotiopsis fici (strain W106-1 / CGMCC3.15140) TaxID=1229662 RepID=W3XKC2_PESFW|nr:uncharacterized protein PFICI_00292 [Pestalotiopsis fici W106-1]ETS86464.1 hypothetical protein PFICI_00292 [Pestalotiopsis fici W106-1]
MDRPKETLQGAGGPGENYTKPTSDLSIASRVENYEDSDCDDGDTTVKKTQSHSPVPIPSIITGKQSNMMSKMIHLFDDDLNNPIFLAEVQLGYSAKYPLFLKPGIILYDGTSKKDLIKSDIWLPRLVPKRGSLPLTAGTMHAHTLPDGTVAFTFSVNIEIHREGKFPRETFEWRKVKNHEGGDGIIGTFNLVWLRSASRNDTTNGGGSQRSRDESIVASLSYVSAQTSSLY